MESDLTPTYGATQEQIAELGKIVAEHDGWLFPEAFEYMRKNFSEMPPSINAIYEMLQFEFEATDKILKLFVKLDSMEYPKFYNKMRDLWLRYCPEGYIENLIETVKRYDELHIKAMLAEFGAYSQWIFPKPRWPSFIKKSREDTRRKIPLEAELIGVDMVIHPEFYEHRFDKKLTYQEILDEVEELTGCRMNFPTFKTIVSRYKRKLNKKQ